MVEPDRRGEEPELLDLENENGLTDEEAPDYLDLVERCEAGVTSFENDEMSHALVLVENLRDRWRRLNSVACAFASDCAELRLDRKEVLERLEAEAVVWDRSAESLAHDEPAAMRCRARAEGLRQGVEVIRATTKEGPNRAQ